MCFVIQDVIYFSNSIIHIVKKYTYISILYKWIESFLIVPFNHPSVSNSMQDQGQKLILVLSLITPNLN